MRKATETLAILPIGWESNQKTQSDNRREQRSNCERAGRVIVDETNAAIECTFKDISWFGARLELNSDITLPEAFKIAFSNGMNVSAFHCKQVWRNGKNIGVLFSQEEQLQAS
jgi:hypothetical protein